ncbi:hypothetical protein B7463_g12676, partial [Scytalidium lignicola]
MLIAVNATAKKMNMQLRKIQLAPEAMLAGMVPIVTDTIVTETAVTENMVTDADNVPNIKRYISLAITSTSDPDLRAILASIRESSTIIRYTWYCCQCGSGPNEVNYVPDCLACGHTRCADCRVETSRIS